MMQGMSQRSLNGVVTMSVLRKQGDKVSQVVYFNPQPPAGFVQIPNVLTTVLATIRHNSN
jgi:hypothetical protein